MERVTTSWTDCTPEYLMTHLKNLSRPEDGLYPVGGEEGDPAVHELEQDLEVLRPRPVQDDDELAIERRGGEDLREVGAAGCQHETVRFKRFS